MKLSYYIELNEQKDTEIINQFISNIVWETIQNITINEGLTDLCKTKGGKNALEDTIDNSKLQGILDRIAKGESKVWELVLNKSDCMNEIVARIKGGSSDCDVTVDNPAVKKVVVDNVKDLWMKVQTAGAQSAGKGVKAAFDAMKATFNSNFLILSKSPASTKA